MHTLIRMLALGLVAGSLATGATASSAEAKGFKGGHGHHFLGGNSGGHRFVKLGFGHDYCWKFGKWVCGLRGY